MSVLDKHLTLVLNALYIPIGTTTIKKALVAMNSSSDGEHCAAEALDLAYDSTAQGLDFMSPNTFNLVKWEDWIGLPIRDFDIPIHTPKIIIRAPIVIVAKNYTKIPVKEIKLSKKAVYSFYNGKCIWTGRTLTFSESSLEHMVPKSHNGKMDWNNIGLSDKKLNQERGATPLEKWKYKPKYKLKKPLPTPIPALLHTASRPEWQYFLIKKT